MKTKLFNVLNRRLPQGTKWSYKNYKEFIEIITDKDGRVTLEIGKESTLEIGKESWHCHLKINWMITILEMSLLMTIMIGKNQKYSS